VVVLDALKEQIARLLKERVDGKVEGIEVREEWRKRSVGVLLQSSQVWREGQLLLGCLGRQLMEERGEKMRVAHGDGQLNEDVLVPETALLQALGREFALLVCRHERGREAVCAQVQGALRAPAHIVDKRHGPLVQLALVVELVLDGVEVDEVAHARARVPAHVVRVHVDFPEELDHLVAVRDVGLETWGARSEVGRGLVLAVRLRSGGFGEGKRVCNFEDAVLLHADQAAGSQGWERLAAGGGDLDRDLHCLVSLMSSGVHFRNARESKMAGLSVG